MIWGAPKYKLVNQDMIDESGEIEFCGRLSCPNAEFDGVVIGYKKFRMRTNNDGTQALGIDHVIISIPESLSEHKQDINNKIGKVHKRLAKEIDKVTSILAAQVIHEYKNNGGKPDSGSESP